MPVQAREIENGLSVVGISGRLVFGREVEGLEAIITDLLQQGKKKIVLDMSALDYVDSAGIGTLVACLSNVKKAGGEMRLAAPNARVSRLLSMTGVDKLVASYPSLSEAQAG
jgi:anti-sigma B factor antagonist